MKNVGIYYILACLLLLPIIGACGNSPEPAPPAPALEHASSVPAELDLSQLQAYTHSSGLFEVDIPPDWQANETTHDAEIAVSFSDSEHRAIIQTNILQLTTEQVADGLVQMLATFLQQSYGSNKDFVQRPATVQSDRSLLADWSYTTIANTTAVEMHGTSILMQHAGHIGVLSVIVPASDFERLQPQITTIRNSYRLLDSTHNNEIAPERPLAEIAIRSTAPFTATNGLFHMQVPQAWPTTEEVKSGEMIQRWNDPTNNAWMMVCIRVVDSQHTRDELASLLADLLTNAFQKQRNFTLHEPVKLEDGRMQVEWSFLGTSDNQGSVSFHGEGTIVQHGDKIAILTLVVPETHAQSNHQALTSIVDSFTIDETIALP